MEIILPKPNYDPHRLPERMDFQKATREFPLSRKGRNQIQIALSKLNKDKIKEQIKAFKHMEYQSLEGLKKGTWEKISKRLTSKNYSALPQELKDEYKMAIWCKFCGEFAEKYLNSLEQQKII